MRRAVAVHPAGHWREAAADRVTLPFHDRHRRRLRLVADSGRAFLLDLPRARHLTDGDELELDDGSHIRVCAADEPVIEIAADRPSDLLRIAWHIGNRHTDLQIVEDRLRIRRDHVLEAMLGQMGASLAPIEAPFDPEAVPQTADTDNHDH